MQNFSPFSFSQIPMALPARFFGKFFGLYSRPLGICLILSMLTNACTVSNSGVRPSSSATPLAPGTTVITTTTVTTQTTTTIAASGVTTNITPIPSFSAITTPVTSTNITSGTGTAALLPTPTLPSPTAIVTNTTPITGATPLTVTGNLTPAPAGAITNTSLLTGTTSISATIPLTSANANIVQLISAIPGLETLAAGLTSSGMASALQGAGPFTLFAPTDAAFQALPPDQLQGLLNNPTALVSILQYHLVIDDVTSSELATLGVVLSSTGQPITITVQSDGSLAVDTARILQGDIRAANGVIHIINQVLIPPTQ